MTSMSGQDNILRKWVDWNKEFVIESLSQVYLVSGTFNLKQGIFTRSYKDGNRRICGDNGSDDISGL